MRYILGIVIAAVFVVLALVHVYWALDKRYSFGFDAAPRLPGLRAIRESLAST